MKLRHVAWIGLTPVVGCGEPSLPEPLDPAKLDWSEKESKGEAWQSFLEPAALNRAWMPSEESKWSGHHKNTLFAAIRMVTPSAQPVRGQRGTLAEKAAEAFLAQVDLSKAAVFVDLPGPETVAWGMTLARRGGVPVSTFNSWPHHRGLNKYELTLGALLYYAEEMSKLPKGAGKPVFMLDDRRLGEKGYTPSPQTFDNRYFHMYTDFPTVGAFQSQGIEEIFYVTRRGVDEEDDLNSYFVSLQSNKLRFFIVNPNALLDPKADLVSRVRPYTVTARTTIFDQQTTAQYATGTPSSSYYRRYTHYHGFWYRSRSTFGDGGSSSGGSGRGWGGSG